jgi:hypothetical protein
LVGLRRAAEATAVFHHSACSVGLVIGVRAPLDIKLFMQSAARLKQSLWPRARDRPSLLCASLIEPALSIAQPPLTPFPRDQRRRQLVAAGVTELLVLARVDLGRLLENLARDLLVVARRALRRVGRHLGPIDREHSNPQQPCVSAQSQHLAEQFVQRALVTNPEARDGGVIGRLVGRDDTERNVLSTTPLDPP